MSTATKNGVRQHFIRLRLRGGKGSWLVHPDLKARIVDDAEKAGTNMTAVTVGILAQRYGVPYEPTGRRTKPTRNGYEFRIYLSAELARKIERASIKRFGHSRPVEEIRYVLQEHYGLPLAR